MKKLVNIILNGESLNVFALRSGIKQACRDFPGGAVVGSPLANAGDTGLSTGPGRSHMPRSS